jgi:hypothetical protein
MKRAIITFVGVQAVLWSLIGWFWLLCTDHFLVGAGVTFAILGAVLAICEYELKTPNNERNNIMSFDPDKPCMTKSGLLVRVLCKDARGPLPIVALIDYGGEYECVGQYDTNGSTPYGNTSVNLINTPEKRTIKVWFNVYRGESVRQSIGTANFSRAEADNCASENRIACIEREITYTVGEGL